MDRFDDDTLFAELRELRPKPRPEFTAELDERAAAGFPRRADPSKTVTPFTLLADHWRAMSPRRRLMPVLALALAALVVATAIVAISQSGGSHLKRDLAENGPIKVIEAEGGVESAHAMEEEVRHSSARQAKPGAKVGESCAKGTAGCSAAGEFNGNFFGGASGGARKSSGSATAESAEESGQAIEGRPEEAALPEEERTEHASGDQAYTPAGGATSKGAENGPVAAVGHRDIERSAYIILGTKPGEVGGAAGKVFQAVHVADGIVLHSSVDSGKKGATGALFELLIPTAKVDDALASISQIAEVRARHDATTDITEPTVSAAEELADSNASIEGLLKELGSVETEAERESVEARLREERRHHASIRGSLDHLRERGAMSEVTVRIVTSRGAGVTPPGEESNGSWGVGDALHDAGHILTIAAGIVLIGLAVLAPIALIALVFWLGNRFRVRRLRERTLS